MRSALFTIMLAALLATACRENVKSQNAGVKVAPTSSPTSAPTAIPLEDGDFPGKGKVTKIDNKLGSVELDHEEIVGVMPRMIMEFYVSDKSMLKGLAVGDQVHFVLRQKGGSETIIKISKAK